MRSERGQATIEWIGILLLVTLALAALSRLAPRADGNALATTLAHSITDPKVRATSPAPPAAESRSGKRSHSPPPGATAFVAPPLVPRPAPTRARPAPTRARPAPTRSRPAPTRSRPAPTRSRRPPTRSRRAPSMPRVRELVRWARRVADRQLPGTGVVDRLLAERVRRGAGTAWRRAWYACLVYERFRWAFLHPESRFPGYTMPPSEVLRIINDCVSPVDLFRDWPMLRGRAG